LPFWIPALRGKDGKSGETLKYLDPVVLAVGDIDPAIDVGADIVHDAAAECSSVISWRLLRSAVSGAVFAVLCISTAHPIFAVAAPMVGSGRQALGGWRRKNTDEARRRRSRGGQANRKAEGSDQS
jgi:hypothetical protein